MTNVNDERILELRKQIDTKKEKLGKTLRFTPVTNCIIELDGVRLNIQVLPKEQLVSVMVRVNAYLMSARALEVSEQYMISGYRADEWIADIKAKIDILSRKEEERVLANMEARLSQLLSEGKKVELQIDEIASLLKS